MRKLDFFGSAKVKCGELTTFLKGHGPEVSTRRNSRCFMFEKSEAVEYRHVFRYSALPKLYT
jgi:hypothetical protein